VNAFRRPGRQPGGDLIDDPSRKGVHRRRGFYGVDEALARRSHQAGDASQRKRASTLVKCAGPDIHLWLVEHVNLVASARIGERPGANSRTNSRRCAASLIEWGSYTPTVTPARLAVRAASCAPGTRGDRIHAMIRPQRDTDGGH